MDLLAIDVTQILVVTISGIFSLATLVVTILLKGKVDSYKKEVDGMKTELVAAVAGKYQAEGELKGAADQKKEAAVNIALKVKPPLEAEKPVEVKIVDQTKPVEVTNKPKK